MQLVFTIAVLVMSVVIHETSHGYAAYWLGDPTAKMMGRLTLNPIRHLDPVGSILVPGILALLGGFVIGWAKPVPYDPDRLDAGRFGPAIVAAAGPLSNILLAVIFSIILRFAAPAEILSEQALGLVSLVVLINIMLAVFNLIPVPPLDGSKILFSILPFDYRKVEYWFARYQFVLIILLMFVILNTSFLDRLIAALFSLLVG